MFTLKEDSKTDKLNDKKLGIKEGSAKDKAEQAIRNKVLKK